MKIITIHPGHNANVGYFEDGACKLILHEEKFNNIKSCVGFPTEALAYLAKKINFSEVDSFVIASDTLLFFDVAKKYFNIYETYRTGSFLKRIIEFIQYKAILRPFVEMVRTGLIKYYFSPKAIREAKEWLHSSFAIPTQKIRSLDHHLAHCLTPIYFFGLQKLRQPILTMSLDGTGDFACAKIFIFDPKTRQVKILSNNYYDASPGLLYARVTKFLGMKGNEHEYKVMGLAAYNTDKKYFQHIYNKLAKIIWLDRKTLTFKSKFNTYVAHHFMQENLRFERFDNVAAAVQRLTEDLVISWIKETIKKTGISTVAFSGGVFMNVKMNQKIVKLPEIKKAYFQPSCGDDSLVIGAAAKQFMDENLDLQPIKTMYLGHEYDNIQVEKFLRQNKYFQKYKIKFVRNIEQEVAKLLAKFNIVARFKGRGEWGARSLCHRAILGNASDLKTFYQVNDAIKMRDFWMPFAPSILDTWAPKYIENWSLYKRKALESTKYMIITFDSTPLAQNHLRAAMHQKDKTLRPQIVAKSDNPDLYQLLKYYEKFSGMGGLLNTSLNLHGYPLVGTLEQAMFTFENSGLKIMAIENYLIHK